MKDDYHERVAPRLAAQLLAPADWREISAAMEDEASYRFCSSLRYNVQEMCFLATQSAVERAPPEMIEVAQDLAQRNPRGGSLRVNPALDIPRCVASLDVHLVPGGYAGEHVENDIAQVAVAAFGENVFTGHHPYRKQTSAIGDSISRWLSGKYPAFAPGRILDFGTTSGRNLFPYLQVFPDDIGYGIDVSAPVLRFGNAIAQRDGYPVHFSQ